MIAILIITMITLVNCLEPKQEDKIDEELKKIIGKYIGKIPDVEPQYVINEGLSKVISHYFKEKVSTFPLYKISLTLDRNPVKIPWTLADPKSLPDPANFIIDENKKEVRTYKYVPPMEKGNNKNKGKE